MDLWDFSSHSSVGTMEVFLTHPKGGSLGRVTSTTADECLQASARLLGQGQRLRRGGRRLPRQALVLPCRCCLGRLSWAVLYHS